uniref:Uncharacterized protein n=1 Tax=Arundo donax TaxID=35708 RepID=A0A0A9BHR6_ARUDO
MVLIQPFFNFKVTCINCGYVLLKHILVICPCCWPHMCRTDTTISLDKILHQMPKAFPLFSLWENMLHRIF